jgi:hypothetical protein
MIVCLRSFIGWRIMQGMGIRRLHQHIVSFARRIWSSLAQRFLVIALAAVSSAKDMALDIALVVYV